MKMWVIWPEIKNANNITYSVNLKQQQSNIARIVVVKNCKIVRKLSLEDLTHILDFKKSYLFIYFVSNTL